MDPSHRSIGWQIRRLASDEWREESRPAMGNTENARNEWSTVIRRVPTHSHSLFRLHDLRDECQLSHDVNIIQGNVKPADPLHQLLGECMRRSFQLHARGRRFLSTLSILGLLSLFVLLCISRLEEHRSDIGITVHEILRPPFGYNWHVFLMQDRTGYFPDQSILDWETELNVLFHTVGNFSLKLDRQLLVRPSRVSTSTRLVLVLTIAIALGLVRALAVVPTVLIRAMRSIAKVSVRAWSIRTVAAGRRHFRMVATWRWSLAPEVMRSVPI